MDTESGLDFPTIIAEILKEISKEDLADVLGFYRSFSPHVKGEVEEIPGIRERKSDAYGSVWH